ncbi:biopolymer transporter ExbD [Pusillimonas caeni]|uniref:ExbD/TolR family protein n=1 Tax=Pusillimonas caeni TaxID=1348472 RepID=UPI000E59EC13|nr:biopolymer transporter ExbD [Pusillimonas caeni]TFL11494.1 biopolymer transporter ExbD [Pusillimonas caeni]
MAFGSFDNKSSGHTMSEINMVPLIDVMLVLLVIFIITAPLISHSIKINVPQVSAEPVEQEPKVIDLAVNDQGQLFWNEQPVLLEDLTARLKQEAGEDPQPQLRIRADLNTRYEILAEIMGSARASGMKRVGFVTRPSEKSAAPAEAGQPEAGATAPSAAPAAPDS